MNSWYIRTGASGKQQGPFTPEQIEKLKAEGRIRADMEASRDGVAWASVVSYGLASADAPAAPRAGGGTRPMSSQVVATGGGLRPTSKSVPPGGGTRPASRQAAATGGTRTAARPPTRQVASVADAAMLLCPACGSQVTADAARCPRCPCPLQDIAARNAFLAEHREFEATRASLPAKDAIAAAATIAGRSNSRVLVTQESVWAIHRWAIQQAAMGVVACAIILYVILGGASPPSPPVEEPTQVVKKPDIVVPRTPTYDELIVQAETQTVAGDIDGALASYARAAEANPRIARPHMMRAYLYARMNDPRQAREEYERATRVEPDFWEAWRGLGDASQALGDDARALAAYRSSLSNGAPEEHRLAIAKLVDELDLKLHPETTPVAQQEPLPEPERLAIESLVRDWNFAEAARGLEPHRDVPVRADAVKLVEQHLKDHEDAARTMYIALLMRQVDDLETRQQFGPAINALRRALAYVDEPAKIQAAHSRIDTWRKDTRDLLVKRIETLRNYLGTDVKTIVLDRLADLAATDAYSGSAEVLKAIAAEFEAATEYDRSWCDAWIARLPTAAPFSGEEPVPAGPRCPACSGVGHRPCSGCQGGLVDGRCYLCEGQGRITCRRCGGGTQQMCRRCGGTGIAEEIRKEREKCGMCAGTGKTGDPSEPCGECKGVGSLAADTRKQVPCKTCRQSGRVPCELCEQKGQRACPNCKGAGQGLLPHEACAGLNREYCVSCRGLGRAFERPALPLRSSLPVDVRPADLDFSRPGTMAPLLALRATRASSAIRYGGSGITEACVDSGLAWLAEHQSRTGQWEGGKVGSYCPCHGPGKMASIDTALTGLALLAFLGAGETPLNGEHRGPVTMGLQYLCSIQDVDGRIGEKQGPYMYNHAIGTLALVEAYGMTQNTQLKVAATRALMYLLNARAPGAGWRYVERDVDTDVIVTEWAVCGLWCARKVGLSLPRMEASIDEALVWFESVTNQKFGITGYKSPAEPDWQGPTSERYDLPSFGVRASVTHTRNHTPTAIGIVVRERNQPGKNDAQTALSMQQIAALPPNWDLGSGGTSSKLDYVYWFYGTQAMIHVGGESWQAWNTALRACLPSHQHNTGHLKGSWDPIDAWGYAGGRVYATAINVLTLETYYRYARTARK